MAHLVYLALGSNLGERLQYLQKAIHALSPEVLPKRSSSIFESEPWGFEDQGKFLNMVLEAETDYGPLELLSHVKQVEIKLGRQPTFRNGPREIDIDILLFDDIQVKMERLEIPHPHMHERLFVMQPLAEIAPYLVAPNNERSANEHFEALQSQLGQLRKFAEKIQLSMPESSIDNA